MNRNESLERPQPKAGIPNTKMEDWFYRVTQPRQIKDYNTLAYEKKLRGTATAHATNILDKTFTFLVEYFEAVEGIPVETIQDKLYPQQRVVYRRSK